MPISLVPAHWILARLSTISIKIVDGNHNPPAGQPIKTEYRMLSSQNIDDGRFVNMDKVRYLTKEQFLTNNQRTRVGCGDILFTSVGSLGRSLVMKEKMNICFQRSVSVVRTLINSYYLKSFFDSPKYQNYVVSEASGTAQKAFI